MSKRSYRQSCGVAKALDVLGERWTLLIVRNLLVGGLRYKDLLETLPGITTNLLAERLRDMTGQGLIAARELPPPANAVLYELTPLGRELEPVVLALGRFGARYLGAPKRGDRSHVRWAMVALKRRYRPGQQRGCIALSVDHIHHYRIRMQSNTLDVAEGPPEPGDDVRANLTADGLRAMLFHDASTRDLLRSGQLVLEGKTKTFFALIDAIGASA